MSSSIPQHFMQANWKNTQLSMKSFSLNRTRTGRVQISGDKNPILYNFHTLVEMKAQRASEPGLFSQDF